MPLYIKKEAKAAKKEADKAAKQETKKSKKNKTDIGISDV